MKITKLIFLTGIFCSTQIAQPRHTFAQRPAPQAPVQAVIKKAFAPDSPAPTTVGVEERQAPIIKTPPAPVAQKTELMGAPKKAPAQVAPTNAQISREQALAALGLPEDVFENLQGHMLRQSTAKGQSPSAQPQIPQEIPLAEQEIDEPQGTTPEETPDQTLRRLLGQGGVDLENLPSDLNFSGTGLVQGLVDSWLAETFGPKVSLQSITKGLGAAITVCAIVLVVYWLAPQNKKLDVLLWAKTQINKLPESVKQILAKIPALRLVLDSSSAPAATPTFSPTKTGKMRSWWNACMEALSNMGG